MIENTLAQAIATCGIWLDVGLVGLKSENAVWIVAISAMFATMIIWTGG